jgi:hypothetical protein
MTRPGLGRVGPVAAFLAATAAAIAASAVAAPSSSPPPISSIKTSPSLFPSFKPDVRDYVARCGDQGLHMKAKAPSGAVLKVDGVLVAGTSVDQVLPLEDGEETNLQGQLGQRTVTYHIRCLPADFPTWRVHKSGTPQAEWYLTTPQTTTPQPDYVTIFDHNGVPVWWMHSNGQAINATLVPHQRIAWAQRRRELLSTTPRPFEIHSLDGTRVGTVQTPDVVSDWHELQPLSNGDFLVLGD